jgi:uncharacterized phage-associated protein
MSININLIAQYFISKSQPNTARVVTHLKLQKLIYYAQGYFLAENNGEPLFDDRIEAWVHGPVCPALYSIYRKYDYSIIPHCDPVEINCTKSTEMLERIWKKLGALSGPRLEDMTHKEHPWITARESLKPWQSSNIEIPKKVMEDFFKSKPLGDI